MGLGDLRRRYDDGGSKDRRGAGTPGGLDPHAETASYPVISRVAIP